MQPRYPILTRMRDKNLIEISDYLQTDDWKEIGWGCYSRVLTHKKYQGWVLKIYQDKSYDKFISTVRCNKTPYFPKSTKPKLICVNGDIKMVFLEKLQHDAKKSNKICNVYYSWNKGYYVGVKYRRYMDSFLIVKTLSVMNGYSIDLHSENVMFRRNIPVITDPFTP